MLKVLREWQGLGEAGVLVRGHAAKEEIAQRLRGWKCPKVWR